jgi:hypothetical protein
MSKIIAGLLEHRLGESLATRYNQPLLAGLLSFVARTVNSYLGTQVGHFFTFLVAGSILYPQTVYTK